MKELEGCLVLASVTIIPFILGFLLGHFFA